MRFRIHYLVSVVIFLFGFSSLGFAQTNTGTVNGVIYSQDNRPLQGVNITVAALDKGTTTDTNGEFNLSLPTGSHKLVISYVGYQKSFQDISI